jgi:hypothetical protein
MVFNTTFKFKNMKYVIVLLFALAFSNIDAQNLQFSQVISEKVVNGGVLTVPSGKVWKIEYATIYGPNTYSANIRVNNSQIVGCYTCAYEEHFPIWVKANDVISFNNADGYISAIEFTIVP